MRRALGRVGLAALVVVGLALVAGAVVVRSALGADGVVRSTLPELASPPGAHTVLIDVTAVEAQTSLPIPGRVDLLAQAADGRDLTLATGSAETANGALAGTGYAVAALQDGAWTFAEVPGAAPVSDIDPRSFAAVQRGNPARVSMTEPATVLLRNADGAAPVVVELALEWRGQIAAEWSLFLAGAGGLLLIVALGAGIAGRRRRAA